MIHIDLGCDASVSLEYEENAIIVKDSIHKFLSRTIIEGDDLVPEAEHPGSNTDLIASTLQSIKRESSNEK